MPEPICQCWWQFLAQWMAHSETELLTPLHLKMSQISKGLNMLRNNCKVKNHTTKDHYITHISHLLCLFVSSCPFLFPSSSANSFWGTTRAPKNPVRFWKCIASHSQLQIWQICLSFSCEHTANILPHSWNVTDVRTCFSLSHSQRLVISIPGKPKYAISTQYLFRKLQVTVNKSKVCLMWLWWLFSWVEWSKI